MAQDSSVRVEKLNPSHANSSVRSEEIEPARAESSVRAETIEPARAKDARPWFLAWMPPARTDPNWINDKQFMKDLQQLKDLRSFLIREAVSLDVSDPKALSFENLNLLRFNVLGRMPTELEWTQLEYHTRALFGLMTEPLRRRFIRGSISWWMTWMPVIFAFVAVLMLLLAVLWAPTYHYNAPIQLESANVLPFYVVWLMMLGAIGAVGFIGMNALSIQEDITFDLTNVRLMILRVTLGALFALILTLPFGFDGFVQFCRNIVEGKATSGAEVTTQALMLLLPFVLGFSTSLVITILNRLLDSVQAFFGKSGPPSPPPSAVKA